MSTEILEPVDTKNDAIKLPFNFDADKIIAEVEAMPMNTFIYYNVIPLRSPAHLVDPSISFPPPAEDYADGSWCDWLNTKDLESSPYLKSIVEMFQEHTTVTLVRALRLEKGNVVKEHCDVTLGLQIEKSVIRLTIPVIKDEGAKFYLNNNIIPMKPGECWYMRLTDPHQVINKSERDRINIAIDMIPNEWVRNLILTNDH
jgi:hypothetical protein